MSNSAALLKRMSTPPKRSTAVATMRSMSSRRVTSAVTAAARPGCASINRASEPLAGFRSTSTQRAPSSR